MYEAEILDFIGVAQNQNTYQSFTVTGIKRAFLKLFQEITEHTGKQRQQPWCPKEKWH